MACYCCLHPLSLIPINNLPPFRPGFDELSDEAKSVALRDSLLQMNEFMEQIKIRVLEIIPLRCCSKCEDEILFMVSEGNRVSTQLRGMLEDLRDRSGPVFKRRRCRLALFQSLRYLDNSHEKTQPRLPSEFRKHKHSKSNKEILKGGTELSSGSSLSRDLLEESPRISELTRSCSSTKAR